MSPPSLVSSYSPQNFSRYHPSTTISSHDSLAKYPLTLAKATILRQIFFHPSHPRYGDTDERDPIVFPQCASYRPTEIVESVERRDESWLWWRQTSPRICLTACQRFLLLSILICSVNNGGNEEGNLAASSREGEFDGKRSSPSWYERVVNQRGNIDHDTWISFLGDDHLSLSFSLLFYYLSRRVTQWFI